MEILNFMKESGFVKKKNDGGLTLLEMAYKNKNFEMFKYFIKCGYEINEWKSSLFHKICSCGDIKYAKLLLEDDFDVDFKCKKNTTAFSQVCYHGNIECMDFLLKHGADINKSILISNNTALEAVCSLGDFKCVEYLIKHGANINNISDDGNTPLHTACNENSIKCVELLINSGAIINNSNSKGLTPLSIACNFKNIECADLLIKNKANINCIDDFGNTPLMTAIISDNSKIIKYLGIKGANAFIFNNSKKNTICKLMHDKEKLTFLLSNVPSSIYTMKYIFEKHCIGFFGKYKLRPFINQQLKLEIAFLMIVNSNNKKSELACFFAKFHGLKRLVAKKIVKYINAF